MMKYKQTTKIWRVAVHRFLDELIAAASQNGVDLNSVVVGGGYFQSKVTFEVSGTEYNVRQFMTNWTFK